MVENHDLSSLRLLGSVGEPINPEAWMWYHINVGSEQAADRRHVVADRDRRHPDHAAAGRDDHSSRARPTGRSPASSPKVVKDDGKPAGESEGGKLVIEKPWPGMLRGTSATPRASGSRRSTSRRTPASTSPATAPGSTRTATTGSWAASTTCINVSGHRLGTAEVESALVSHAAVAEAAVVGYPHDIKGEGIYAYVTLKQGVEPTDVLKKTLIGHVRTVIGPIATPDKLQFAPGLPKTRSGKIMRRILRKIAHNEIDQLGDTSTLLDPAVVDTLVKGRQSSALSIRRPSHQRRAPFFYAGGPVVVPVQAAGSCRCGPPSGCAAGDLPSASPLRYPVQGQLKAESDRHQPG